MKNMGEKRKETSNNCKHPAIKALPVDLQYLAMHILGMHRRSVERRILSGKLRAYRVTHENTTKYAILERDLKKYTGGKKC